MQAKLHLKRKIAEYQQCVNDTLAYTQGVIRNGLAVIAFALIEYYTREVTAISLAEIDSSNIGFILLPEKLRKGATVGAIDGIRFRQKFESNNNDRYKFIADHAQRVGSLYDIDYRVTGLSFFHSESNISTERVFEYLKAIGYKNYRRDIEVLASYAGYPSGTFIANWEGIIRRRHDSAHVGNYTAAHGDIQQFPSFARTYGFVFGFMSLYGVFEMNRQILATGSGNVDVALQGAEFRAIEKRMTGEYAIRNLRNGIVIRVMASRIQALRYLNQFRRGDFIGVVEFDEYGFLVDWYIRGTRI